MPDYSKCTKLYNLRSLQMSEVVFWCVKKTPVSWPTEFSVFVNIELIKNKLVLQTVVLFYWYGCGDFLMCPEIFFNQKSLAVCSN